MNRRWMLARGVAVAGVALVATACAYLAPQPPAPTEVRMVLLPFLSMAPLAVAEEEGYFKEQNLTVKPVQFERGADALPALAQGSVDVLPVGVSVGLFNAAAHGTAIRVVASLAYMPATPCSGAALVARRDLVEKGELATPAQLRGRRVSVSRANFEEYWVERVLTRGGLTMNDLTVVDLSPAAELDALQNGSVDVVSTSEPWTTRMVQGGFGVVWARAEEHVPDFPLAYILYGPSLREQHADVGERFMTAYLKAVRKFSEGKTARNLDIASRLTHVDRGLLEQGCWLSYPRDARINVQAALDFQDWAVKKGLLDASASPEQLWDPRFVDAANQALGGTAQ